METIQYKTPQAEMIYKAIIYVLRAEGLPYEEKFEEFFEQLPETDAIHLADLLDGLHDFIKSNTSYHEEDDDDDEDEVEE